MYEFVRLEYFSFVDMYPLLICNRLILPSLLWCVCVCLQVGKPVNEVNEYVTVTISARLYKVTFMLDWYISATLAYYVFINSRLL